MSYNVLSLRMSVPAVVSVIRACSPDVVCLQEVPRFFFWRRRLDELARATGLRVVSGHRRAGAVAVLVRPEISVIDSGETRLRWKLGHHRRGVAAALLEIEGHKLTVASVHMSLYDDERARHVAAIRNAIEGYGAPVVIAGDINETPEGEVWRGLATHFQDAYAVAPSGEGDTFSAQDPRRRIDAVFVDRALTVIGCGVPAVPDMDKASDHRPLVAVLALD
jgi:endonuclease/exonuclease/phosphatase family metal-dependent hydrolase